MDEETKECPRCKMYHRALQAAMRINMILIEDKAEGSLVPAEVVDLFSVIYFAARELNEGSEIFGNA